MGKVSNILCKPHDRMTKEKITLNSWTSPAAAEYLPGFMVIGPFSKTLYKNDAKSTGDGWILKQLDFRKSDGGVASSLGTVKNLDEVTSVLDRLYQRARTVAEEVVEEQTPQLMDLTGRGPVTYPHLRT